VEDARLGVVRMVRLRWAGWEDVWAGLGGCLFV